MPSPLRPRTRYIAAALLLALGAPALSSAQATWQPQGDSSLPWNSSSSSRQEHHHHHGKGASASHAQHSSGAQRKVDDRKLDLLATRYYGIKSSDPHAIAKLKKLEHEVKSYRSELDNRSYDAGDIIKDAGKLESRIRARRKKLEADAAAQAAPAEIAAPIAPSAPSVTIPASPTPPQAIAPLAPAPVQAPPASPATATPFDKLIGTPITPAPAPASR